MADAGQAASLRCLILALLLSSGSTVADNQENWQETASSATGELALTLQRALKASLSTGDVSAGIKACNLQALPLTEALSQNHGIQLSRISERNRNPANSPSNWQLDVLESFSNRLDNGEAGTGLEWTDEVSVNGLIEYRYMKAIVTQAVCLQCHGESLAPEVADAIEQLYPQDRATGYRVAELRGAFVAVRQAGSGVDQADRPD